MRVLVIGDGISRRITTGFNQVLRQVVDEFIRRGWDVAQLCGLDYPPQAERLDYLALGVRPYFGTSRDPLAIGSLQHAVEQFKPNCIFMNTDAGTASIWWKTVLRQYQDVIPIVSYLPIEGAPIHLEYTTGFRLSTRAFTYTEWSSRKLREQYGLKIPYVYHGVDVGIFHPAGDVDVEELRHEFGWKDKYVVMYVARNGDRKGHDRLLKAISIVKNEHPKLPVHGYLHCVAFDNFWNKGWDLAELASWFGISENVEFMPTDDSIRGVSANDLADRYRAADLYVSPSSVEGFGLPLLEAMATGLPIAVTGDKGNQEEVVGDSCLATLEPIDWETWFHGGQLAKISPVSIAELIVWAYGHPSECVKAGKRAQRRALENFNWRTMAITLADAVEQSAR